MTTAYKFLNVKDHHVISEQMFAYLRDHSGLLVLDAWFWTDLDIKTVLDHVPALKKLLRRNSLSPQQIAVIIVDPDPDAIIHTDTLEPYVRLLWPVKNCAGSRTKFYDIPRSFLLVEPAGPRNQSTNIACYPTVERDWRFIGEVELTSPIVFDGSTAHAVHCAPRPYAVPAHTDWFRISFTIGFDKSLPISKLVSAWPDSLQ